MIPVNGYWRSMHHCLLSPCRFRPGPRRCCLPPAPVSPAGDSRFRNFSSNCRAPVCPSSAWLCWAMKIPLWYLVVLLACLFTPGRSDCQGECAACGLLMQQQLQQAFNTMVSVFALWKELPLNAFRVCMHVWFQPLRERKWCLIGSWESTRVCIRQKTPNRVHVCIKIVHKKTWPMWCFTSLAWTTPRRSDYVEQNQSFYSWKLQKVSDQGAQMSVFKKTKKKQTTFSFKWNNT